MPFSIDKLQKFFRLEAERGFDNRAVVGGLDKIMIAWQAEARADRLPEAWVKEVVEKLGAYSTLEPESRAETLRSLWRTLQITSEENPAALSIQPRSSTRVPLEGEVKISAPQHDRFSPRPIPEGNRAFSQPPRPEQRANESRQPESSPSKNAPQPARFEKSKPDHQDPIEQPIVSRTPNPEDDRSSLPPRRLPSSELTSPQEVAGLNANLTVISGVGPKHAETLANLGLHTLGDLLYHFPRRYVDYSQLKPINRLKYGEEVTVIASIQSVSVRPLRGGKLTLTEAIVNDGTAALRLNWFNQPWLVNQLHSGEAIAISGKIDHYLGRLVIANPEVEAIDQEQLHTNRIIPIYPLTAKISQRWLRKIMYQAVSYWSQRVLDYLPEATRSAAGVVDLPTALQQCHFPDNFDRLKTARERLAFDEIFLLQLGVLRQKRAWQSAPGKIMAVSDEWLDEQINRLPFQLTNAQQHSLDDLRQDLASGRPMNRLLQGDVGSGKTVIAALTAAIIIQNGAQASPCGVAQATAQVAFMAPTSILANQHYVTLQRLLTGSEDQPGILKPEEIALLIGDTPEADKETIRAGLASGAIKVVVGTHALYESPVEFNDLQLAVIDEQHRFGVEQRAALRAKGQNPHLLVMTATPIPRSLALTIYGDLDLSVMDEMPPGRQVIDTHVLLPRERERAYALIRSQVQNGRQVFIIYPRVEQGENDEVLAAVEEHARLQKEIFPRLKIGLLHGRLNPEEKDSVMERFRSGETQLLVSTSVVEVGVDVPNATVMLVEGANHFGLAQLHQFRGRVGRGSEKSYCLLIPATDDSAENERLAAMAETNNGFILAERDLAQRGPGEFLGTRQAGFADLRLASLTDVHLIEKARQHAQAIFDFDPDLVAPENQPMLHAMRRFWREEQGDIS